VFDGNAAGAGLLAEAASFREVTRVGGGRKSSLTFIGEEPFSIHRRAFETVWSVTESAAAIFVAERPSLESRSASGAIAWYVGAGLVSVIATTSGS
jgi:hypothetical protein